MTRVLVACEFSGIVRDAFRAYGYDAWSCDLESTERPGPHIQDDVLRHLDKGWDLMIAHPPCDYLANSGVSWRVKRREWDQVRKSAMFFKRLLDAPIPKKAVENPIMHKYGVQIVGRPHDFCCQPYQFGDPFKKGLCFWTVGLLPLEPTSSMDHWDAVSAILSESPNPDRKKNRSRFYPGVADAMATQWGAAA